MKTQRAAIAKRLRPSICTSRIAIAAMVLAHVSALAPSASATILTPVDVPFGTQVVAPLLSDATG